jgi:hypothetical protein
MIELIEAIVVGHGHQPKRNQSVNRTAARTHTRQY